MKIFKQVTLKKVTQGFLFSIFYPVDETNNYIWWEKKDLQTQILAFATSMARTLIKRLLCSCFYISKVGRHFWRHSSIPSTRSPKGEWGGLASCPRDTVSCSGILLSQCRHGSTPIFLLLCLKWSNLDKQNIVAGLLFFPFLSWTHSSFWGLPSTSWLLPVWFLDKAPFPLGDLESVFSCILFRMHLFSQSICIFWHSRNNIKINPNSLFPFMLLIEKNLFSGDSELT